MHTAEEHERVNELLRLALAYDRAADNWRIALMRAREERIAGGSTVEERCRDCHEAYVVVEQTEEALLAYCRRPGLPLPTERFLHVVK